MLGEIGDPRAYPVLLETFKNEERQAARRRVAISMGACLSPTLAMQFPADLLSVDLDQGRTILRELTGADLGPEAAQWRDFLSDPVNLKVVVERCRQKSKVLLG